MHVIGLLPLFAVAIRLTGTPARVVVTLIAGTVIAIVLALAQVGIPWVSGRIVDRVLVQGREEHLGRSVLLLAVFGAGAVLFSYVHALMFRWVAAGALSEGRQRLWTHLERLPVGIIKATHSGELTTLLTDDLGGVTRLYSPILSEATLAGAQGIIVLLFAWSKYGAVIALALLVIPVYVAVPILFTKYVRRATKAVADARGRWTACVQELLRGVLDIKVLSAANWARQMVVARAEEARRAQWSLGVATGRISLKYGASFAMLVALYYVGGRRVLSGEMTPGDLVALISLITLLEGPAGRAVSVLEQFHTVRVSAERLRPILEAPEESDDSSRSGLRLTTIDSLELRDVSYSYDGTHDALRHVSFSITRGERILIVGPNGAGKSTLVALLLRLCEPTGGQVLINGIDSRRWPLSQLRERIVPVTQAPVTFAGTVFENIALGAPRITRAEVAPAAQLARADAFIDQLADGFGTLLGEHGATLSGGQRQKLAIARAIVRNPDVLILDEGTSQLDAASDRLVSAALAACMHDRTTIIVSHRFVAVPGVSRIIVLDHGEVSDEGGHSTLMASCSVYRSLAQAQLTEA